MIPYLVNIRRIDLESHGDVLIPVEELQQSLQQKQQENLSRQRIAQVVKRVRRKIVLNRQKRQQIIEQTQQQAEEQLSQWQREAQADAVAETLFWHVQEAELTAQVVDKIQKTICRQIWKVLSEWALEQNPAPYLINRLTKLISENSKLGALTLLVAPQDYGEMYKQFGRHMMVERNPLLGPFQAELVSSTLTIKLDLEEHLGLLLSAFISPGQLQREGEQSSDGSLSEAIKHLTLADAEELPLSEPVIAPEKKKGVLASKAEEPVVPEPVKVAEAAVAVPVEVVEAEEPAAVAPVASAEVDALIAVAAIETKDLVTPVVADNRAHLLDDSDETLWWEADYSPASDDDDDVVGESADDPH
ncbi:MAG: hypothetical protein ACRC5A_03285 [Enterobacteriaceae bacterium]